MPRRGPTDEPLNVSRETMDDELLTEVRFDDQGLVPVVAQDVASGEVLMLAYADREALKQTMQTGFAHYHSRSRGELWRKGATSGNEQRLRDLRYDCDADAVLYLVEQTGVACHTGKFSCFHNRLELTSPVLNGEAGSVEAPGGTYAIGTALAMLEAVISERLRELPDSSYVRHLHERGIGYVAQKVIEEAGESVVAALQEDNDLLIDESADLLFHHTMLLHERGISWADVAQRLIERNDAS